MKCKDCIFEIDSVCINPQSDWCDMKLFPEYDGCEDGTLNKTPNAFSWESTRCCPRCKSNLVVKIFGKHLEDYCPLCGQRIDWSDAE